MVWLAVTFAPISSFSASVRRYTYRMRNMSRLWVGDSQTVEHFLREEMHIPPQQVLVWPLFQGCPDFPRARPWDGQSVLQIGSVGRLHEVKNYAGLLDALAAFLQNHPQLRSRLHFTILGDGPEREALEAQIARLALSDVVSLPGFSADVASFLSGLHVYIQTSRYEGMCLAVHEAMNAALPVIATPVGEIRDAVTDGETGYVLNGDLNEALTGVLERIFASPQQLEGLGEQARHYVLNKFSRERYTQAAATILDRLSENLHTKRT